MLSCPCQLSWTDLPLSFQDRQVWVSRADSQVLVSRLGRGSRAKALCRPRLVVRWRGSAPRHGKSEPARLGTSSGLESWLWYLLNMGFGAGVFDSQSLNVLIRKWRWTTSLEPLQWGSDGTVRERACEPCSAPQAPALADAGSTCRLASWRKRCSLKK